MTITQILQKIKSAFYTKAETDTKLNGKSNIVDTVLKTNTEYTFRNYSLNSLNIDEKYNENYVVAISVDGYGTRPVGDWTNIINFCTYHFITQLCIPIHPNKDTDCMYIRTRWCDDVAWGEWRKSANDNSVVHKSGNETINGVKTFGNDIVLNGNFHLRHSRDDGLIRIQGGSGENKGSRLILSGKDRQDFEGAFELMATDGTVQSLLKGTKTGLLTWCGKNVDCIDSQGDGWIRYTNGIQICWGNGLFVTGTEITYPKPFSGPHTMSIQATVGNIADANASTHLWEPTRFFLLMNITGEQWVAWQAIGTWK